MNFSIGPISLKDDFREEKKLLNKNGNTYKRVVKNLKINFERHIKYHCNRKICSIPAFTPNCFWFIICFNYFSRGNYLIYGIDAKSEIDVIMNYKQRFSPRNDDIILQNIKELKSQSIDFDNYYAQLEKDLISLQQENDEKLKVIHTQLHEEYINLDKNFSLSNKDKSNIPIDLYQIYDDEYNYLDYLESTHSFPEKNDERHDPKHFYGVGSRTTTIHSSEMICNICLEEDYSYDNLIVLCSVCNICVHQKCYNLMEIPKNDWICDLCLQFGKNSKEISCILCSQKGGVLKETDFSNELVFQEKKKRNFCNKSIKIATKKSCWIHLSCIFWIPELKKNIELDCLQSKDFSNIEKWRFIKICDFCKKENVGVVIGCSEKECNIFFHVECGIRNGLHFEKTDSNYNAYCQKHIPFKLKKIINSRISIMEKEIVYFLKIFANTHYKLKCKQKLLRKRFRKSNSTKFIMNLQKKKLSFKALSIEIPKLSTVLKNQKNKQEIKKKHNLLSKYSPTKTNTYIIIDSEEKKQEFENSDLDSKQKIFNEINEYKIKKIKDCRNMKSLEKIESKSTSECENMSINYQLFFEK